jgi:hypothetical protein
VLSFADVEVEASIDDAGARLYHVLRAVFTLPADPPPQVLGTAGVQASLGADTAAELLGLAARIYAANQADAPALADRVIVCAVALGGRPCGPTEPSSHHRP